VTTASAVTTVIVAATTSVVTPLPPCQWFSFGERSARTTQKFDSFSDVQELSQTSYLKVRAEHKIFAEDRTSKKAAKRNRKKMRKKEAKLEDLRKSNKFANDGSFFDLARSKTTEENEGEVSMVESYEQRSERTLKVGQSLKLKFECLFQPAQYVTFVRTTATAISHRLDSTFCRFVFKTVFVRSWECEIWCGVVRCGGGAAPAPFWR
jgi:hypothetical protein